jgi:hypothetical protein
MDIIKISDTEFRIGDNHVFLLTEENMIYIEVDGVQTDAIADAHLKLFELLITDNQENIRFLINLNNAGKSTSKARQIWQEISESEFTNRVALYGIHPVAKVLATFVTGILKKNNVRFFKNKAEALSWLNG